MNISPLAASVLAVQGVMLLTAIVLIIGCARGVRSDSFERKT